MKNVSENDFFAFKKNLEKAFKGVRLLLVYQQMDLCQKWEKRLDTCHIDTSYVVYRTWMEEGMKLRKTASENSSSILTFLTPIHRYVLHQSLFLTYYTDKLSTNHRMLTDEKELYKAVLQDTSWYKEEEESIKTLDRYLGQIMALSRNYSTQGRMINSTLLDLYIDLTWFHEIKQATLTLNK